MSAEERRDQPARRSGRRREAPPLRRRHPDRGRTRRPAVIIAPGRDRPRPRGISARSFTASPCRRPFPTRRGRPGCPPAPSSPSIVARPSSCGRCRASASPRGPLSPEDGTLAPGRSPRTRRGRFRQSYRRVQGAGGADRLAPFSCSGRRRRCHRAGAAWVANSSDETVTRSTSRRAKPRDPVRKDRKGGVDCLCEADWLRACKASQSFPTPAHYGGRFVAGPD
jgi:hypothetical protein